MEEMEFQLPAVKDMDKCAIIYRSNIRSNPVSFIYVCFHCGADFADVGCILKHIESHFQIAEVTVDESSIKSECNYSDDFEDSINIDIPETTDPEIDIKAEVMKTEEDCEPVEKPNTFVCHLCDSVFSSKFALLSHTVKDHFKEQVQCKKCGRKLKRDASIKSHLRQHIERGEVDWSCEGDGIVEPLSNGKIAIEYLERKEKSDSTLQVKDVEMKEIQPEKRQPEKKKKKSRALEKQKQEKTEKKSQTSEVRSKQKSQKLICHKCSNTFRTSNDLNDHLNSHSTSDMQQLSKCKECETYFESDFDLRLHVLEIHFSEKKFKCSKCSTEFKKRGKPLFKKHLELHLEDKSADWSNISQGICCEGKDMTNFEENFTSSEFSCELCEEKFYLKSNIDEHIRCMHKDKDKEDKFHCPQCKAIFTRLKVSLQVDLRCSVRF